MPLPLPAHRSPIRLLAGWVLMLVFTLGQTPVLPLTAAAFALLDGGHELEMVSDAGGTRLVLHHCGNSTAASGQPAHSPLVSWFAAGGSRESDHVVTFAAPTAAEKQSADSVSGEGAVLPRERAGSGGFERHGEDYPIGNFRAPGPICAGVLAFLRHEQMLI